MSHVKNTFITKVSHYQFQRQCIIDAVKQRGVKKNTELYKMSGKLHSVFLFFAYLESLTARVRSSVMSENIGHLQVVPV